MTEPAIAEPADDAEKFKLTLYVSRDMVDDFDEAWARIKRGSRRSISRSEAFEAAIRVAMEREPDIRERLGIGLAKAS